MNSEEKMIIRVCSWFVVIILFSIALMLGVSGCSFRHYDHSKFDAEGNLIEYTRLKSDQWILNSRVEDIYAKVADPCSGEIRELSIGRLDQDPDSESVKAISEGIVEGIGKAVKGL